MEKQLSEMEKKDKGRLQSGNIVLFPFMAQGHLNPFIGFANLLASRHPSLTITLVTTPANVLDLRPIFSSIPSVRFAQLPFNSSDHGLPPGIEHTRSLSRESVSRLYLASQSLQPSFNRLIESMCKSNGCNHPPVLAIVSDMFMAWSVDISRAFGVYHAVLYTSGPYAMSIYNSIWHHLPFLLTCGDDFSLPDLPHITLHRSQLAEGMKSAAANGGHDHPSAVFVRRQEELCRRSDACLWNTTTVLEQRSLKDWSQASGQPCWSVGPLHLMYPRSRRKSAEPRDPALVWLDQQEARSVVYVSFGSQNSIGRRQMAELARGLEASGRPFVWTVRPPIEVLLNSSVAETDPERWDLGDWLPDGFEKRMREIGGGLLLRGLAPQVEILGHVATGAFISHCGWNSLLESLGCGVPLIGWPLNSEQFYNVKLVEDELGSCLEMARGEEKMIAEADVVKILEEVMEGERGREVRKRAEELRAELKKAVEEGGELVNALDDFLLAVIGKSGGTHMC